MRWVVAAHVNDNGRFRRRYIEVSAPDEASARSEAVRELTAIYCCEPVIITVDIVV